MTTLTFLTSLWRNNTIKQNQKTNDKPEKIICIT